MVLYLKILSIIIFFVLLYNWGYGFTRFIKVLNFETIVLRLAVGLAVVPVISLVLNILCIPLDWRVFLIGSLVIPVFDSLRNYLKGLNPDIQWEKDKFWILVIGIFLIWLGIYVYGAFKVYPYLEDDDPWSHAGSIKFIAVEKHLEAPLATFQYLNPYPPGYALWFALMHQINPDLVWVMKFFNALMVSLSFPFFYLFAAEFTGNKEKAFWATLFLSMIPCFMTHFIWAHSLVLPLFFPAFYCTLKSRDDTRWIIPGALIISGIFLIQPTKALKFTGLFLIFMFALGSRKISDIIRPTVIFSLGVLIALLWWGLRLVEYQSGELVVPMRQGYTITGSMAFMDDMKSSIFHPQGGSATRAYEIMDYIKGEFPNLVNNPVGVGPILFMFSLFGIYFLMINIRRGEDPFPGRVILGWWLFTFVAMNSVTFHLPVGLFAFRFWALFAIPTCLLAAETTYALRQRAGGFFFRKAVFVLLLALMVLTSCYPKFRINKAFWPWGVHWTTKEELKGYFWLYRNLVLNTRVFAFTDNIFVIGLNMRADYWRDDYKQTFEEAFFWTPNYLHKKLSEFGFEYVIIGEREMVKFGDDHVAYKVNALKNDEHFQLVHEQGNSVWVFKLL